MDLLKKVVDVAFDKKIQPTNFLANLFKPVHLKGIKVEIHGRSIKQVYAVDTKVGGAGRLVELSSHDRKEFIVPEYNNYGRITETELFEANIGQTVYEQSIADLGDIITNYQESISATHRISEEKQASDGLFYGKIVLADNSEVVFNKKATHDITLTEDWTNADADPLKIIENGCTLCVQDGKLSTSEFNMVFETKGLSAFLSHPKVKDSSNWNAGVKRNDINLPKEISAGVAFHGQITAGHYVVNVLSYNASYEIPKGFGFANEGKKFSFIPTGAAAILPPEPNFKRYYGAIADVNPQTTALTVSTTLKSVEQLNYAYDCQENGSFWIEAGVKSRPLLVPVDVDTFATIKGIVK